MITDKFQQDFEKKKRIGSIFTLLKGAILATIFYVFGVELTTTISISNLTTEYSAHQQTLNTLTSSGLILDDIQTYLAEKVRYYTEVSTHAWLGWLFAVIGFLLTWISALGLSKTKDILFYKGRSKYYRNMFYQERKKRKSSSEKTENQYQQFLSMHDHIPEGFFLLSEEERILHMNKFAKDLLTEWLDQSVSPNQLLGLKMQEVMPAYLESGMGMVVQGCAQRKEAAEKELFIVPKDAWLHARAFPAPEGIAVYLQDITEKKKPENISKFGDVLLNKVSNNVPMAFAVTDLQWNYMVVSAHWQKCFKMENQELIGKNHKLVLPRFPGKWQALEAQLSKGKSVHSDETMFHLNGQEEWISWEVSPWKNNQGQVGGYVLYANIVTEQKNDKDKLSQQNEREKQLAYHDILTGLPNRQLFYDRLNMALANAYRHLGKVSLMFLDLDGFKAINDNLGHDIGDMLLKEVSTRLKQCVRETDTVARLGGDEFTVILTDINDEKDVAAVANKVISAINEPFQLGQHEVIVSTSVGISMYPNDGSTTTELIKKSDSAMYWSKEHGKNQATFNSQLESGELDNIEKVEAAPRGTLENPIKTLDGKEAATKPEKMTTSDPLEEQLKTSISKHELELHYQPIFNIQSNQAVGVEALLRWNHPELGLLAPNKFLDMAEETGLILPIGEWVIEQTCLKAKKWKEAGHQGIRFCINLSEKQLLDNELTKRIEKALKKTGIKASELAFEVSEKTLTGNVNDTKAALEALNKLGCKIIVDDYGMSYSPLKNVQELPIDMIKVHRSFIRNVTESEQDQSVINTLIALGQAMKITIIGEGVEEPEQADFLKSAGCDYAQGFLLGRPMNPIDTQEFFSKPTKS